MAARFDLGKLLRAMAASVAVGVGIYLFVIEWALPSVQSRLTPAQIEFLRQSMTHYPAAVLFAVTAIAAVLALPVLIVFRVMYGPLRGTAISTD
jgi:hypothetical protein